MTPLRSSAAREILMSSAASISLKQPTVTMSQSRMVAHEKFKPTNGVVRPAAMGFMVMTGFLALRIMRLTVSISTCMMHFEK